MGMATAKIREAIENGRTSLGIELGSTRIKAVLICEDFEPVAAGSHDWTNSYQNGIWTYSEEEVWNGIQDSYRDLKEDVRNEYGVELTSIGSIGFSGMMHGYMVFDSEDKLLVPFRTWRNTLQEEAASKLMQLFDYPIPQRWSIAHLYQAILNKEEHVSSIAFMTTLAGYVHWKLTGEKVTGIGEASGMFPIDLFSKDFNQKMMDRFDDVNRSEGFSWSIEDIMPRVLSAGDRAGALTTSGAMLLDPTGELCDGIPLCPPEGDAGTGMVATNSVAVRTGNVSAGTSVFAMIVLEKELKRVHEEIDLVTTPDGRLVAMVHSNNCSSNLDAWVNLFDEAARALGCEVDKNTLYGNLYRKALEGAPDCGGLLSIGYLSGEHITHFAEGRPLVARTPDSEFSLANFMRANLYTALGALKIGLDILFTDEGVEVEGILGHGGFFKVEGVGQRIMAAAANVPVALMETAGEGGAWGIAVLASYLINREGDETLDVFLADKVFENQKSMVMDPNPEDVKGFEVFMERYKKGLVIEKAAVEHLR